MNDATRAVDKPSKTSPSFPLPPEGGSQFIASFGTRRDAPARGGLSIAMLLALVLAITAQLVTGFAMMAHFNTALLAAHVIGGLAAIVLTIAEWTWLAASRAGRHRFRGFVSFSGGPAAWSESAFLVVATVTVVFGALLAAAIYLGARLPFAALLTIHQVLAIIVVVLYLIHSALAMRRSRWRRLNA